jgi:hypothetical protein
MTSCFLAFLHLAFLVVEEHNAPIVLRWLRVEACHVLISPFHFHSLLIKVFHLSFCKLSLLQICKYI